MLMVHSYETCLCFQLRFPTARSASGQVRRGTEPGNLLLRKGIYSRHASGMRFFFYRSASTFRSG